MQVKRLFLIVLDSFGIGELPDALKYGDEGSNTLASVSKSKYFDCPQMTKMGLFNIDGCDKINAVEKPCAAYAKLAEKSCGKDTTTGHWEICSLVSEKPFPTYPDGFPKDIIDEFERQTNRKVLCNKPYSGTKVIEDYGDEHIKSGALIVYTSADSVFQIAAHEDVVDVETLYSYCRIARKILCGENAVARVIARPFAGESGSFYRTANRHDFSVKPSGNTLLDLMQENGYDTIGVGKIFDIFGGKGISEKVFTKSNRDGMEKTSEYLKKDFKGMCFVNLVDFDMLYGHRNDVDGYAAALTEFDKWLSDFVTELSDNDLLFVTADHGCDPATPSTDHSREYVPFLAYSKNIKAVNLGVRNSFADIGKTIADIFSLENKLAGESFKNEIID